MLKLILLENGKEQILKEGTLKELATFLKENQEKYINWIWNDHDNMIPLNIDRPDFDKIEVKRELDFELEKIDLDWWKLVVI